MNVHNKTPLSAAETVEITLEREAANRLLIVDFDETLWLRNSTEEYLNSLRPRFLGYLILLGLDLLRPWKFLSGGRKVHVYRDWIRVLVCTILLPWSLALWRRRARVLAERWANDELIHALRQTSSSQIQVATLGTDVIVSPLLRHIMPSANLYAAGTLWSGHRIRDLGKKAWIEERFGAGAVDDAIVITDSEHDADLLACCAVPILVQWPRALYKTAYSDAYIPFLYTQRAKRPGQNYMLYGVVLEDLVLLCIAIGWLMPFTASAVLGLLLLHLSFWTIYEIGYMENDTLAAQHEAKPQVYSAAASYADRVKPLGAWLACLGFAVPGVWLLVYFNPSNVRLHQVISDGVALFAVTLIGWLAYVGLSRVAYWTYNRLDVDARSNFYLVLQLFRTTGYAIFFCLNFVGATILLCLAFARWVKYLVYRDAGLKLKEDQRFLMLVFYVVMVATGFAVEGTDALSLQALAALIWLSAYSHRRLRHHARRVRLVDSSHQSAKP